MAKIHCHSLLSGSSWTSFDGESSEEESEAMEVDDNNSLGLSDSTRLGYEDMNLYGLCPAQEDVCLVICKDCSKVVKISAFTRHCNLLHKKDIPPPTPSPDVCTPSPAEVTLDQSSNIKIESLQLEDSTVKIEEVPLMVPKVNHLSPQLPTSGKKSGGSNKKSPRKVIPTREREFDADKHCGVWVQDQQKRCTRSLTCKTHALSLRRAVPGRRKKFDELLAEHKARVNSEKEQQQLQLAAVKMIDSKMSNNVVKKSKTDSAAKPSIDRLQNNATTSSSSKVDSKKAVSEDIDESHLYHDLSTINHHPQPLATSSFNGRKVGQGTIVFNRRQDHLRCAMLAMVEKYLNPQSRKVSSGRPGAAAILHRPAVKTIGQSSNHSLIKGSSVIGDKSRNHSSSHKNLSNFLKAPPLPKNRSKSNHVAHGSKHSLENSYQTVIQNKQFIESSSNDKFDASSQAISDIGNIIASIDSSVPSNRTAIENDSRAASLFTSVANTQQQCGEIVSGKTIVAKMNGGPNTSTNSVVQIAGQLDPSTGKVKSSSGQQESPLFFTQNPSAPSLPNGTGPSPPPVASTTVKGYPALSFVIQGSKPCNSSPVNYSKGHSLVFNSMGMAQMQQPSSPQTQQQPQQQHKGKVVLRANSYPKTSKTNNSQAKVPQSLSPQQQLSPGQPKTIIVTSPPPGQQNLYLNHMTTTPIVQLKQQVEQQQQQLQQITLQKQLHQQQLHQQQLQQQKQLNTQFAKQLPIQPRLAPAPHPPSQSILAKQQLTGQNIVIKASEKQIKSPQNAVFVASDSHQTIAKPQSNVA